MGVKNFGFTEKPKQKKQKTKKQTNKQTNKQIEQGSTKLKELHVCIMRVQKKMAAWRSEVP